VKGQNSGNGRVCRTYINFAQHRKANTIVQLAELLDLIVGAWVLSAELVAREADDFEVIWVLALHILV
jgi:hypothetical protein